MSNRIDRALQVILAGIVSAVGALAIVHLLLTLPFPSGKEPEWVGAIGTVLTLVGTIWLATNETRNRERDELQRARLRAAGLLLRVLNVRNAFAEVQSAALATVLSTDDMVSFHELLVRIGRLPMWTIEDVEPLIPLPNNTAALLAQSADEISNLKLRFQEFDHEYGVSYPEKLTTLLVECYNTLRHTVTNLDSCIETCMDARNSLQRPTRH